ncbi:MAG: PilN domain-containing protein [Patescibacteria group bacterium]|nr:PilN domain-containing protein [Patescibacteria group bacterium]
MDPVAAPGSFIPKQSLSSARRGGMGLLTLIAVIFFVFSVIAAAGAWGYKFYAQSDLDSKKAQLQKYQDAYNFGSIQDLVRFDSRIKNSKQLLNKHIAVTGVLNFLALQTLEKVQFTSFTFDLDPDGSAKLQLTGIADSFSTVALQSDQFGASKVLRDVVFSNIAVNTKSQVSFGVAATIDPSLLLYSTTISQTTTQTP